MGDVQDERDVGQLDALAQPRFQPALHLRRERPGKGHDDHAVIPPGGDRTVNPGPRI
jgi:hypothetical protein